MFELDKFMGLLQGFVGVIEKVEKCQGIFSKERSKIFDKQ
jgi:hypothetical protein